MTQRVHATAVALRTGRRWHAVLLRGPSGAGKSDLALRLVASGARLVADDQTELASDGRRLLARSPSAIAGLLEVRGIGIVRLERRQLAARVAVALLVDLVPPDGIERLPEARRERLLGHDLPVVSLTPFEPSAAHKLCLALRLFGAT